jgi:thiol:disulfide interchange protein DsbG
MSPSSHRTPLFTRRRLWLALGSALALAACGKQDAKPAGKAAPAPVAVSIDDIAAQAKGFSVGALMRAQTIYVFFDPQCPHCATLWDEAKQLAPRARFVWIPVRLLGDKSLAQGAAILAAPDPAAAMEQNEASVKAQQGGITAAGAPDAQKDAVTKNTELFNRYGFEGVPTIVGKSARNGEVVVIGGGLPAAQLAERLGL